MTLYRLGVGVLAACVAGSVALLAASFSEPNEPPPSDKQTSPPVIRMTGLIEEGDGIRLRNMLVALRRGASRTPAGPLAILELSSLGGDLLEGMKLGYMFREFDVATVVRSGDLCLSSCALAFLGGTSRHVATDIDVARTVEIGGTLGFHNFWLNPSHPRARDAASPAEGIAKGFNEGKGAAALLVHYSASLGVDPSFIARILGRPPESWEYADTAGKFIDLKICPARLSRQPPAPERRAVNICVNTLGGSTIGEQVQARAMTPTEAKRYLIEHVRKEVAARNPRGPLAVQLAAAVAARDTKLADTAYADLLAAGLALPEIVGPTFEVMGFSAGDLELECVVSLSPDDPDRFDLVLKGAAGLTRPPRQGPQACGRILGFERSDILNPGKR
jgi:hypothetical protein